jgi:hypothetical protein
MTTCRYTNFCNASEKFKNSTQETSSGKVYKLKAMSDSEEDNNSNLSELEEQDAVSVEGSDGENDKEEESVEVEQDGDENSAKWEDLVN